tara:strand:+ start:148 stop:318 length:171 start_codon:yes stop_codon:yes gene_type:complete
MDAKNKLEYWRKNLSCEEQVKRQLAEEYANADTKEEINLLDEIWGLIYNKTLTKNK